MIQLAFDEGSLLLKYDKNDIVDDIIKSPPWVFDYRINQWRAPAISYREVITKLHRLKIPHHDNAKLYETLDLKHITHKTPHEYQSEAKLAWQKAGKRGVVVLPTGAGKTYLAEMIIAEIQRATLVITPTIDLMNQWYDTLLSAFGCEIGLIGGGYYEQHPITITTYDSAYLHLNRIGNKFGLLIFDECHHLPSPSYSMSAEWAIAPFRLGLSATPERADGSHSVLERLIGPEVYRRDIKELAGEFLADYEVVRLEVDLSEREYEEYHNARFTYRAFIEMNHIDMSSPNGFQVFLKLAPRSEEGRMAFKAFRQSRTIALAATAKLEMLERLLLRHRKERILIFTHENNMVYEISKKLLIPAITHHTDLKERKEILDRFKEGIYSVIATSRVLNEGINLPSANIGIILSGSGSVREHVQRLGRILRRQGNKEALLYEIITRGTLEERVSARRREHHAYR